MNKTIHGKSILSNIHLTLSSGKIYGFTGRNGSGKTMLFRALSGLMSIDSGTIIWNGKILHKDFSVLPGLDIVLENAGLYPSVGRLSIPGGRRTHLSAGRSRRKTKALKYIMPGFIIAAASLGRPKCCLLFRLIRQHFIKFPRNRGRANLRVTPSPPRQAGLR